MKKLTWGIQNQAGELVWLQNGDEDICPREFDSHESAINWLCRNFNTLRSTHYHVVAIVSVVES